MILLTQEAEPMTPMGWALIIGFALILVWGLWYDRNKAKKLDRTADKLFEGKVADGNDKFFITTDGQLVVRSAFVNYSSYNIFSLDTVAYVMTCWDETSKMWIFALYDANKKSIKGRQFISTKKNPKNQKAHLFASSEKEANAMWELVHKYVPKAKHVGMYFRDIKE